MASEFERQNRHNKESYDQIAIRLPEGSRKVINEQAAKRGLSTAAYLWQLVEKDMEENNMKAKNVFTKEADVLTAEERRRILKIEKAKEYSGWRAYPSTCSAIFDNIPDEMIDRYTAKQLGEIAALLKKVYDKGRTDAKKD